MVTANLGFIPPFRCLISVVYGNELPQLAHFANMEPRIERKVQLDVKNKQPYMNVTFGLRVCLLYLETKYGPCFLFLFNVPS